MGDKPVNCLFIVIRLCMASLLEAAAVMATLQ